MNKVVIYIGLIVFSLNILSCASKKAISGDSSIDQTVEMLKLEDLVSALEISVTEEIITALASDDFGGRKPGTDGYEKAASFVEDFLGRHNVEAFKNNSFNDTLLSQGQETYNKVGLIKGSSDDYVMICAHLDHLGAADGKDSVYNGANDNASGVTAVLQVSSVLSQLSYEPNIIVALFSAEESGLLGSKHLASRLRKEGLNLTHVFNFEMIGKTLSSGANQVYITGFKRSNLASEMNTAVGFEFVKFLPAAIRYQLFSRSDNFPFFAEFGIPSHTISTFDFTNYDHYHKASDEVELLDIENMHEVIKTSTLAIGRILNNNQVKILEKDNK